ncbi:MAG: rhomboid family intramembrane serine protease [Fibrobacter sp.]|nr:rhomboid family intramembrane serine protease [Fibrobacter sp.]
MKIRYNSPVILSFALICSGVLLLDHTTNGSLMKSFFICYPHMEFTNPFTYLRIFSHAIGHKDWSHLISNFTLILLIGPILEEKYGSKRLLTMMIISAGITGLLNTLIFPTGLLGASGIVFMFIILGSFTNFKSGDIPLTFILVILLFLTKEFVDAFANDSVSQFAHIMGGICGSVFGFKSKKG